jgi:hypothetical protein
MKRFEFHLSISPEDYLAYYRGTAHQVVARCANGLVIQFPASLLKPFVTAAGIHGDFVLNCDENFRAADLRRLPAGH